MKSKKGYVLLFVLVMNSVLSLLIYTSWYKSSLLVDLQKSRETYYKNYYILQAALNYAILFVKNGYIIISDSNYFPIFIDLNCFLHAVQKQN